MTFEDDDKTILQVDMSKAGWPHAWEMLRNSWLMTAMFGADNSDEHYTILEVFQQNEFSQTDWGKWLDEVCPGQWEYKPLPYEMKPDENAPLIKASFKICGQIVFEREIDAATFRLRWG